MIEPDYEIYVNYLGIDYRVTADLWDHGNYDMIMQRQSEPGGFEVIDEPEFYNFKFIDVQTDLEVLPEDIGALKIIAYNVLCNLYWEKELNY